MSDADEYRRHLLARMSAVEQAFKEQAAKPYCSACGQGTEPPKCWPKALTAAHDRLPAATTYYVLGTKAGTTIKFWYSAGGTQDHQWAHLSLGDDGWIRGNQVFPGGHMVEVRVSDIEWCLDETD